MKHKLKYINLFEELSQSEIPYTFNHTEYTTISFPKVSKIIEPVFDEITEVNGILNIETTSIEYIDGFNNLEKVNLSLTIFNNSNLKYIKGFDSLTQIKKNLRINNNKSLDYIDSFRKLKYIIEGFLNISNNTSLQSIVGFDNLLSINEYLRIYNNHKLKNINGFNLLKVVGLELNIESNSELNIIDNFKKLETVGHNLTIKDNNQLTVIKDFENLKYIHKNLTILGNSELTLVKGFDKLENINDQLWLINNPKLIHLSIPSSLINDNTYKLTNSLLEFIIAIDYTKHYSNSKEFVNSDAVIQDCIDKFNPELHSGVVVKQIVENVELWGTDNTKESIYSHIAQNGNPEHIEHLPDMYRYLYHPKHKNTGAKSVAKVATGVTYGLF